MSGFPALKISTNNTIQKRKIELVDMGGKVIGLKENCLFKKLVFMLLFEQQISIGRRKKII